MERNGGRGAPALSTQRDPGSPVTSLPFPHTEPRLSREEAEARRAEASARIRAATGIDEALISDLVEGFYDRVRADPLLGPVFAERVEDWGPHLARMKQFWSSVALATGVYNGRPMPKHMSLPVDAEHFDRWLALFEETAGALCTPGRPGISRMPPTSCRPADQLQPSAGLHRQIAIS
jgi:hemoglobin